MNNESELSESALFLTVEGARVHNLKNISVKIPHNKLVVITGLSGSGKSSLIRHINRLIDPTSGVVSVEGTNVMDLDPKGLIEFRRH
ncbi:MAG TPA: hypothetical protein DIU39_07010, partial [Flavobacteriales bacterium]|nr:hypothetical protein [Flavobacteriales bacterium]